MTANTDIREMKARILVFGVGGAGGNAVNNMIASGLEGVEFIVANTDAQALASSKAQRVIQMGTAVTQGLGAGAQPEVGCAAAEEAIDAIRDHLAGAHMVFVTAGMGGGTGTGAAPVIARTARELGILTIGVVTKPFQFEGQRRMRHAEAGVAELLKAVDTLLVIPNQNLFRVTNEKTTFADAFVLADQVLYSGVACISDLIVKEGLINLDFADVLTVMREKGKAMMGRGEASGEKRVLNAAVAAISNPLIENASIKRASGLIISITGGRDLALYEVDEAATRIREEVDADANIIVGATFDDSLEGIVRVSVVATGIDNLAVASPATLKVQPVSPLMELAGRLRDENLRSAERIERAAQSQFRSPALLPAVRTPEPSVAIPISDHPRSAARRGPDPHGRLSTVRNSIEAVLDMPALLSRRAN
jgi:cell division protein FtsZ